MNNLFARDKIIESARVAVLFGITLGSLPLFAVIGSHVDGTILPLFVAFGGWMVWVTIVIAAVSYRENGKL